jgi:hypothetical protein
MQFLLLLLRMVLDQLIPSWRDSLAMAARPDGRIEHIPTRPGMWDRWLVLLAKSDPQESKPAVDSRLGWRSARSGGKSPAK